MSKHRRRECAGMPGAWAIAGSAAIGLALMGAGPAFAEDQGDSTAALERSSEGAPRFAERYRPAPLPSPLTLEQAVAFARAHHPDLAVGRAATEVAQAQIGAAGLPASNPEVGALFSRGGESFASGEEWSFELEASQRFDPWGARGQRRRVAGQRLETARVELEARRQAVELGARSAFRRALFAEQRLQSLETLVRLDREVVTAARARVRDGSITPLMGRLTEVDFLRVETMRLEAIAERRQSLAALGAALGGEASDSLRLEGTLASDTLAQPVEDLVSRALARRAEGAVLERRLAERRAERQLAALEGRPEITLGAGLTWERQSLHFHGDPAIVGAIGSLESHDRHWHGRVSLPLPLWQKNQGARARTAAEVTLAEAELARFALQVRFEVEAAARRLEDAARLRALYREGSDQMRADLARVREAYRDGRISLDSYLAEKGRLTEALLAELEAEDAYWNARAALESAAATDLDPLDHGGTR